MAKVATGRVAIRHGGAGRGDEYRAIGHLGSSHLRDEGSWRGGVEQFMQDVGRASATAGFVVGRARDR